MGNYNSEAYLIKSFKRICTRQLDIDCNTVNPDLKMSQIKTLSAFNGSDCLSIKELAGNSGITVARMTAAVNSLTKDGIVQQGKDAGDRRKTIVRLTPQGKKLRRQIAANRRRAARVIYAHLNSRDREILLTSLDAACRILEKISRR
jgi:DNA-binding MarR family transcriptional regulator